MKIYLTIFCLFQTLMIGSCQDEKPFEKEVLSFFQKDFSLVEKLYYKRKDKLRSELFFSASFLHASGYIFKPTSEGKSEADFSMPFSKIAIYYYKNSFSPSLVIKSIDSLNALSIREGNYGPFGKDNNMFFSADFIVVHLERSCEVSEKAWQDLQNQIKIIAANNFKKLGETIDKQCE